MRNFLTMLGIIIGVTAVILVICVGQGIKQQISGQLGTYGKDVFLIQPGSSGGGALLGLTGANGSLLTEADLRTVQQADGVGTAVPLSTTTGTVSGDHTVKTPFIVATTADFTQIIHQSLASGGFFDPDVDSKTVVLGEGIAQKLFNDNAPLGQTLTWRGRTFIVSGVFNDFNAPPFSPEANFNNAVFLPYQTAEKITNSSLGIYQILAKPSHRGASKAAIHSTETALSAAHGGARDVTVTHASSTTSASGQTIHLLTILVACAAAIALVVGGVGIMNMMLLSVTERMHEIGLRKAIGATNQQIMRQFVAEAFVLSSTGAVIGVVFACAGVGLLRLYTSIQAVIVWQALVFTPLLAIAIGLFFGTMPALKAARKDPIEALRQA
jgi:putative ABC transport system permease protein